MRKDAPVISCFEISLESTRRSILDHVCVEIERGSWNEIVGPAGAGKTMLFSTMSLRGRPPHGRLVVCGRNLERVKRGDIAELRRQISSCGETPILLEDRTVIENLVLPFVVRNEAAIALETAEQALEKAELTGLRDRIVRDLSRQQKLAVGLARATVGKVEAILVDSALDQLEPRLHKPLLEMLKERHLSGVAVVLFGREFTENARRGKRFRLESGVLEPVELPTIVEEPADEIRGVL